MLGRSRPCSVFAGCGARGRVAGRQGPGAKYSLYTLQLYRKTLAVESKCVVTWGSGVQPLPAAARGRNCACDGGRGLNKVSWESLSSSGDTRGDPSAQERWRGPKGRGRSGPVLGVGFCLSKHLTEARERLIYNCCVVRNLY